MGAVPRENACGRLQPERRIGAANSPIPRTRFRRRRGREKGARSTGAAHSLTLTKKMPGNPASAAGAGYFPSLLANNQKLHLRCGPLREGWLPGVGPRADRAPETPNGSGLNRRRNPRHGINSASNAAAEYFPSLLAREPGSRSLRASAGVAASGGAAASSTVHSPGGGGLGCNISRRPWQCPMAGARPAQSSLPQREIRSDSSE
jgi:hypothetical protein